MNCPVCNERMREVERSGIQIDICPGCKGVWLDRGELDKILEREARGAGGDVRPAAPPYAQPGGARGEHDSEHHREHDDEHEYREGGFGRQRKRRSWLGNIFDSFGGDD